MNIKDLDYPLNLIAAVFELDFENEDDKELFENISEIEDINGSAEYVLHTLSVREQQILKYRFVEKLTYEDIGKSQNINVTRERVRQIEVRALRKLRHPDKSKYLKFGVKNILQGCREAYCEKICEIEEKLITLCKLTEKSADEVMKHYKDTADLKRYREESESISHMKLSVRPYNCLARAGCETVEDVASLGVDGLDRLRNLGKHSKQEVIYKLKEYGYILNENGSFERNE